MKNYKTFETKQRLFEEFGQTYISFVRDWVIRDTQNLFDDMTKTHAGKVFVDRINQDSENIGILRGLLSSSIDRCLHYNLFMLEQYQEKMQLSISDESGDKYSLVSLSDELLNGELYGALYTEDGWIEKYTKYNEWKAVGENFKVKENERDELWKYINKFYGDFLRDEGLYEEFYECNSRKQTINLIEVYKNEIFINYCPNCGNIKKTPKARQCLECGEFHDPEKQID